MCFQDYKKPDYYEAFHWSVHVEHQQIFSMTLPKNILLPKDASIQVIAYVNTYSQQKYLERYRFIVRNHRSDVSIPSKAPESKLVAAELFTCALLLRLQMPPRARKHNFYFFSTTFEGSMESKCFIAYETQATQHLCGVFVFFAYTDLCSVNSWIGNTYLYAITMLTLL